MDDRVDLKIRGTLVNVVSGNLEKRTITIKNGHIVGFSDRPAARVIEAEYITPGLINAHMHIEAAMVTVPQYAHAVLPHGVTCIIADPHEIGNVLGEDGVRGLLKNAGNSPLKLRVTVPSSVPASEYQDGGASIGPKAVERLLDLEAVVGLAEVMNVDAVVSGEAEIHKKIRAARQRGLTVDGHLPRVSGAKLDQAAQFLDTDHESIGFEEAEEKIGSGLRIQVREGSSSKNLDSLEPLIEEVDSRRLSLCTDNFYPDDLAEHGGIGRSISRLISRGHDPVEVVQMGTINAAESYDLDTGRVVPGAPADLVLLNDLESWDVEHVIVDGTVDPEPESMGQLPQSITKDTVAIPPISPNDLAHTNIDDQGESVRVRVIDHRNGQAQKMIATLPVNNGRIQPNIEADILPVAVIGRHGNGGIGTGFVHGIGLNRGAIGGTIAHDAHNLVVVGATHEAMTEVAKHIGETRGGVAVYDPDNQEIQYLPLPIAGLMTDWSVERVSERIKKLESTANRLGLNHRDGISALDNISLEVIPQLRLTNKGLFDSEVMEYISVVV
jgi:adenine deaminase